MRLALAFPLALAACVAEPDPEAIGSVQQASTVVEYAPSDSETPQAKHQTYVGATGQPGSGWLVVFLRGANSTPAGYTEFLVRANAQGFHVIGLSYWDTTFYTQQRIEDICNPLGNLYASQCWGDVRKAMFDGSSVYMVPSFVVPAAASMKARLQDLFTQLPAEWDQFKQASGLPKWSKIILAGHSMGAGNAAWIAQHRSVHRLVMMSQPQDYIPLSSGGTLPADWIDDGFPSLTGASIFGLAHKDDTVALYSRVRENWGVFGITQDHTVDPPCIQCGCTPPSQYCGAHRLSSDATVNDPHNAVANDEAKYGDAWDYMLTHDL